MSAMAGETSSELDDSSDLSIAIVVARDDGDVTRRLLRGAEEALRRHGVEEPDVFRVATSFELPVVALALAEKGQHDAIVCIGAPTRDQSFDFEIVATQAAAGIMQIQLDTGVPVTLGLLAAENTDDALARSGPRSNRGAEAAEAALLAAAVLREIQG